jgi:hypothetical protein
VKRPEIAARWIILTSSRRKEKAKRRTPCHV